MVARSKRDEILDVAERMIRVAGYNGFSAREIADEVGIKSASVHYHFKTKSDIGVAVTDRYTARFMENLGDPDRFGEDLASGLAVYVNAFRYALVEERHLCLCAMLGAEQAGLPDVVSDRAQQFFQANLSWLIAAHVASGVSEDVAETRASLILAALEGALIMSLSLSDDAVFERVVAALTA
jgi:TetR/AcrR family transcriptional repressor of nem operon